MKNIFKMVRTWKAFKQIGFRSLLPSLFVHIVLVLSTVKVLYFSSGKEALSFFPLPMNEKPTIIWQLILLLCGYGTCYIFILLYELSFGKSISDEWHKLAEGIRSRHPETSTILYFLERGDIRILSGWISLFDSLRYGENTDQMRALLAERKEFDQRILISEGRLNKISSRLRVSPPSTEELQLTRSALRWQYYVIYSE